MSEFLDHFRAEQIGWSGRPLWLTLSSLRYRSDRLGVTIVVPAEFVSDGATVPRLPLAYLIAGGKGNRSALLHDWAYQRGAWLLDDGGDRPTDRHLADDVFHESLLADPMSGVGRLVAWQMWAAVRLRGRGVWADHARAAVLNPIWEATGWPTSALA